MLLLINTADPGRAAIALAEDDGHLLAARVGPSRRGERDAVLPAVERLLWRTRRSLSHVRGVAVVTGPGPFSGLRAGIAIANALGFALGVGVVGISAADASTPKAFAVTASRRFTSARAGAWVAPTYGAEPQITIKRKT